MIGEIRKALLRTPGFSDWPHLVGLVERDVAEDALHCWDYPASACEAVGGRAEAAVPGAAAVFCLLQGIHLVDDILDEDPKGLYRELGPGRAANLALALQAAASRVVESAGLSADREAAILARIARISLDTAYGQELDLGEVAGEEDYWNVVRHKTPPLFSGALYIGAVLGGAELSTAEKVGDIGLSLGKLIQVSDDVKDALSRPAETDWQRGHGNLPILFACTADHPHRERFLELLPAVFQERGALEEAQDLLVKSGAVSFCVYHIVESYRAAIDHLSSIGLPSPRPLEELLRYYLRPVEKLFKMTGFDVSKLGV